MFSPFHCNIWSGFSNYEIMISSCNHIITSLFISYQTFNNLYVIHKNMTVHHTSLKFLLKKNLTCIRQGHFTYNPHVKLCKQSARVHVCTPWELDQNWYLSHTKKGKVSKEIWRIGYVRGMDGWGGGQGVNEVRVHTNIFLW